MPANPNTRFLTPPMRAGDGLYYYWMILPAYDVPLTAGALTYYVNGNFTRLGREKWSLDKLPLGLASYDTMKIPLNLSLLRRTASGRDLYEFLTDDGRHIAYGMYANTTWVLMQGETDDPDDATAVYIGVQVHYMGQKIKVDRTAGTQTCELELVSVMKAALEAIPMKQWSADVRLRTEQAGGMLQPIAGAQVREICYNQVYKGSGGNFIYASAQRTQKGDQQGIWIPYLKLFERLQAMVEGVFRKLLRSNASTFTFHGRQDGAGVGTPFDYVRHYALSLSEDGQKGNEIPRNEKLWLAFVRMKTQNDAAADVIGGMMWENDGLAKAYTNILDYLKDATEEGCCKAFFFPGGNLATSITGTLAFLNVWWGDNKSPIPDTKYFSQTWTATRGANVVGGCQTTLMQPRGQNIKGAKWLRGGMSDNIRPYAVKCTLFTGPCIAEFTREKPSYYFIFAPSNRFGITAGLTHEFSGNLNVVVAQGGFTVNRWYYAHTPSPSWYQRSDAMIIAVHHWCDYDVTGAGGLTPGNYTPSFQAIPLPVWPSQISINDSSAYYHNTIVGKLFTAMIGQQRQSSLSCLSETIGKLFSNRSQTEFSIGVHRRGRLARPSVATDGYCGRFLINPANFDPDVLPQLARDSVIIDYELDFQTGRDQVAFFTRTTTM